MRHWFPKEVLPKLDVGHLHVLHREKASSHLTLILRYSVIQEFLGEDGKQTGLAVSLCLQVYLQFFTKNFLVTLVQSSIQELQARAERAMLLKMPAVREDLYVDTWDTAATWLLLLGGENLMPFSSPVHSDSVQPTLSMTSSLLLLPHQYFCHKNMSEKNADPQIHTLKHFSIFAWSWNSLKVYSSDLGGIFKTYFSEYFFTLCTFPLHFPPLPPGSE